MDPYLYPGTDVLQNIPGIRDPATLSRFEAGATSARIRQLEHSIIPGKFDATHVQAIHRYIFQDAFSWAGEFRTVGISRSGPFAFCEQIVPSLHRMHAELARERYLEGHPEELSRNQFAGRAAHYLGELNAIHPFREGNGRTQREYVRQLAARCGHRLGWAPVTRDQMYAASVVSFLKGDNTGFERILHDALET